MAEPSPTPAHGRRPRLRRARWVAVGASVGATIALTGTIAAVNAAPQLDPSTRGETERADPVIGSEEYGGAQPFTPDTRSSSGLAPQSSSEAAA